MVDIAAGKARERSEEHASAIGLSHRRIAPGHDHPSEPLPAVGPPLTTAPVSAPTPAALTADPGAEVAATAPARHVQPAIAEAAKQLRSVGGRTSLIVRLDPPELGAVLVRLTVKDGQVDVTLRTPDLAARNDLQAQAFDVQQVLREQGLDLSSFDVAHGDVLSGGGNSERQTPDRATPRRFTTADGSANVTDDVPSPQPAGTWL